MKPGFYQLELNRTDWIIPERYVDLIPLAAGAYGCVCSATDAISGQSVVIKKLKHPFQNAVHSKRTYREMKLLRLISHDNIIDLLDLFTSDESLETIQSVYLVSRKNGADLGTILKSQVLAADQIQLILYQVLRGLKFVHSAGLIHRDLKPSNIAVTVECDAIILDFGLARQTADEMTGYVATRWYRAPEVLFNWTHYNETMDIWSVGCIMAELMTQKPLFPGSDHYDQLNQILDLLGTPGEELLAKMTSESGVAYIRNLQRCEKKDFSTIFAEADLVAVDLMQRMLELDPDKRITCEDALAHAYFESLHDAADEPSAAAPFDLSFENENLSVEQWKELIWNEIMDFSATQQLVDATTHEFAAMEA